MPELPEVETIRRQLENGLIGKRLANVPVVGIRRRGKILIIDFKNGSSLLFHLKLTGQIIINGKSLPQTRKVFYFDDGTRLVFNDARKFGWWRKVRDTKKIEKELGPESLEISLKEFVERLRKHGKAKIKSLLMDQKFIAGIGNIYSDEILFAAKIHPLRQVRTLSGEEKKAIYRSVREILQKAIKGRGSSVKHYLDARGQKGAYVKRHKVYQKEGKKCFRCGAVIRKIKIGGRSARFCPQCQKL